MKIVKPTEEQRQAMAGRIRESRERRFKAKEQPAAKAQEDQEKKSTEKKAFSIFKKRTKKKK